MPPTQAGSADLAMSLDPGDYTVAWIAPLEIEAQAALLLLDERHRGRFPVGRGDDYVYHAGTMRGHNVIIATLPAGQEYGTGSAGALAGQVKKFFPNLWFGLLVGVAAGLPSRSRDIRLGDVLVALPDGESAGLVPYDLGKELVDGFQPLRLGHALGSTEPIVRSAIGSMKVEAPNDAELFLPYYETIRDKEHATGTFDDPGQEQDILHMAQDDETETVFVRPPRLERKRVRVWYGPIGSGDKLLRSATKRNELRDKYGFIGLEMEAAGVMNRIPVGVVRGVCDYGDTYKNKDWQPYAAAMAASYAKALLDQIPPRLLDQSISLKLPSRLGSQAAVQVITGRAQENVREPCYHIQLKKNPRFTGRASTLSILERKIFGEDRSRRTALVGLGGVGKTQITLHFAYHIKEKRPDHSIFWVPILSSASVEQAYGEIAKKLGLQKSSKQEDIKELVCQYLSTNEAGKWLFIVDNADDPELFFGSANTPGMEQHLPESEHGSVLLTTRSRQVAVDFAQADVIDVNQMDHDEARVFFEKSLVRKELARNEGIVTKLLTNLTYLPLAITQAAAYLNQTKAPIETYMRLLEGAEKDVAAVLGREFRDNTRYRDSRNAVGTTWLVSFDQIKDLDQAAINLLRFLSCIEPKSIPQSILPSTDSEDLEWAIGTLCGYSFLVRREDRNTFDMHSLVHAAIRGWIKRQDEEENAANDAMHHLTRVLRSIKDTRDGRISYLPHALQLFYQRMDQESEVLSRFAMEVRHCLYQERRFKESVRCGEVACRWMQNHLPEDNSDRLASEHDLASSYLRNRQIQEGIEILMHVTAVMRDILDEKDPKRLKSELELATAYLDNGRIGDAIRILEHITSVDKTIRDERDHLRLFSEHSLASAYLNNHQVKDAIEILQHLVELQKNVLDERDQGRLDSEHELARAYIENKQVEDAIEILERVVHIRRETLDETDFARLASEHVLAYAYVANDQTKDAIVLLEHVVAIEEKLLPEVDRWRRLAERELAHAYLKHQQVEDAITVLEHVVRVESEHLEADDPDRDTALNALAIAYKAQRGLE